LWWTSKKPRGFTPNSTARSIGSKAQSSQIIVPALCLSRTNLSAKPINFYAEINERLRQESGVPTPWTVRDLWLSVQREAGRLKKGSETWTAWAAWIASGRHPNAEDFEVEL